MAREVFVARPTNAAVRRRPARAVALIAGAVLATALLVIVFSADRSEPGASEPGVPVDERAASSTDPSNTTGPAVTQGESTNGSRPSSKGRAGALVQGEEDPTDEFSADHDASLDGGAAGSASDAVLGLLRATDFALRGVTAPADAGLYASGMALSEVDAAAAEFAAAGWRQDGEAIVIELQELDAPTDRDTVVVEACIDSSKVAIIDADGNVLRPTVDAGERRALQRFEVERLSGTYKVVRTGFPDDADC